MGRAKKVKDEIRFIRARESSMSALTGMLERGEIPQRVTHNDTKLNNLYVRYLHRENNMCH